MSNPQSTDTQDELDNILRTLIIDCQYDWTPESFDPSGVRMAAKKQIVALINSQALKLLDRLAEKRSILTVPEFNEKCIPVSALQEERKRYE